MKEAKKGVCRKCGTFFYVHKHHILPKSRFGRKGKTMKLCPNCHTHFHEYSKKHTTKPSDKDEALDIWQVWFKKVSVVVTLLAIAIFATKMFF